MTIGLLLLLVGAVQAAEPVLTGTTVLNKPVPELYERMGRFCDVPSTLLYAVAVGESGRALNGKTEPWNWTLNIAGIGYYYESREAQFNALMTAITAGKIVDVGPMQLNWRWKFDLLPSPWLATDPAFNIHVACKIIRWHYEADPQAGWFGAAGKYHREADRPQDFQARQKYVERVRRAWERL